MLYKLPANCPVIQLDVPGALSSVHLNANKVVELSTEEFEWFAKEYPAIARISAKIVVNKPVAQAPKAPSPAPKVPKPIAEKLEEKPVAKKASKKKSKDSK